MSTPSRHPLDTLSTHLPPLFLAQTLTVQHTWEADIPDLVDNPDEIAFLLAEKVDGCSAGSCSPRVVWRTGKLSGIVYCSRPCCGRRAAGRARSASARSFRFR